MILKVRYEEMNNELLPVAFGCAHFGLSDVGCYADSARGMYIGAVVIELAAEHGFTVFCETTGQNKSPFDFFSVWQDEEERLVSLYHSEWEDFCVSDVMGDYLEVWEEAENYLNLLCDSTVYFGTSEGGDWGLWPTEEEEGLTEDDLCVSQVFPSGAWEVSAMIDGIREHTKYFDYTREEAIASFLSTYGKGEK